MAHIVGVPKREPCEKCNLPVFLAERLTVGKSVYHRTCLKCARCDTQLTPGSFYETEIDGEYCCETCPDEEKSLTTVTTTLTPPPTTTVSSETSAVGEVKKADHKLLSTDGGTSFNRNSIADRLAFFEMNGGSDGGKRLLQKSMSDEEKTKSLKKITQFQPNVALKNFMTNTLSSNNENNLVNSENDNSHIEDIPPELPTISPPNEIINNSNNEWTSISDPLKENDALDIATSPPPTPPPTPTTTTPTTPTHIIHNNDLNVSVNNITKDISNSEEMDDVPSKNITTTAELFINQNSNDSGNQSTNINNKNEPLNVSNNDEQEQSNVVRARLQQFEILTSSSAATITINNLDSKLSSENNDKAEEEEDELSIIDSSKNDNCNHLISKSNEIIETTINDRGENEVPKFIKETNDEQQIKLEIENASYPIRMQSNEIVSENSLTDNLTDGATIGTDQNETAAKIINNNDLNVVENQIKLLEDDKETVINLKSTVEIINNELTQQHEDGKNEFPNENHSVDISKNCEQVDIQAMPLAESLKNSEELYPDELNPFQSDDDEDAKISKNNATAKAENRKSLNPFGSSDDDDDDKENSRRDSLAFDKKSKPPRPPPPRISKNPFGSDTEDDADESINEVNNDRSLGSGSIKKIPIPTPRNQNISTISVSKNSTPEPTPRSTRQNNSLQNSGDYYGSSASLNAANNISGTREYFHRHHEVRGSNSSLTSSTGGGKSSSRKLKKAPAPPPPSLSSLPSLSAVSKELFPGDNVAQSDEINDSKKSTPSSSNSTTPHQQRKKRPAPKPPTTAQLNTNKNPTDGENSLQFLTPNAGQNSPIPPANDITKSELEKLSDEEKAAHFEGKQFFLEVETSEATEVSEINEKEIKSHRRRLISVDASLIEDANSSNDIRLKEEENVVYRRSIRCDVSITPMKNGGSESLYSSSMHDRQLEKMKDNKEAQNRNRQSQIVDESDPLLNKSFHGKWKRRKGPAPSLPIPPRKVLQMLPLQEIRHELEIIEVQQQGLEKQGVILEKMIRERCEGINGELNKIPIDGNYLDLQPPIRNSKEVEDLILQLFELVNEKNELFRRQAELMYLRRQHRLEQEQADLEYEIRVSMAQPERNKTDTDKAREEALIARMVEVVQSRNDVIERLEMDRLREAEEDLSIKQQLELHTSKRDEELCKQTPTKLSKKEKKKQKESKKLGKSKKLDADKDADESELNAEQQHKDKKKKKKFLF